MNLIQAVVLGIIQGLTEFLPISSSAHLIFVSEFIGWGDPGLAFSVALHLGTLIALLAYFWRDIISLVKALVASIRERSLKGDPERKLSWLLLIGSIPGAVAGALWDSQIEEIFHTPANRLLALVVIAGLMAVLGAVLWLAERYARHARELGDIRLSDALLVGLAQALALLPGVSRSGGTITTGLLLGLQRDTAARFSFLLAIPIVGGAGALEMYKVVRAGIPDPELAAFVVGFVSAAVVGYLCVKLLLQYLRQGTVNVFAYYRFAAAAGIIVLLVLGR